MIAFIETLLKILSALIKLFSRKKHGSTTHSEKHQRASPQNGEKNSQVPHRHRRTSITETTTTTKTTEFVVSGSSSSSPPAEKEASG